MTLSESVNLYERIVGQVIHTNLREAFVNLSYLIQQNGFGLAFDQLNELESNYRYLLKFRLEGVPDPGREKVYADLKRRTLNLADESFHLWMCKHSPQLYFDAVRAFMTADSPGLNELRDECKHQVEELVMAEIISDETVRNETIYRLSRKRERLSAEVFNRLLVTGNWSEQDLPDYKQLFTDLDVLDHEKALFVSAILLSLLHLFDEEKILLLIDLCLYQEPEVSQRAMVAAVIVMYLYDGRLDLYPNIGLKWEALMETEGMRVALERVSYQLIRSKDTDNVTRKMQEEILPEMTRFGSAIQDKLIQDEADDATEDFNPDWKNMMENPGFSAKMQEFSDMQMEGVDVYMSTFSGQKFYPFFQELSNWFLPFYSTHSSLRELFSSQDKGAGIVEMVLRSGFLCSSDKYSFCFNILQLPSSYRSSMANNLGAETENYEELRKAEAAMNPKYIHEQLSNRYIHDLYRFFHLHNRKRDFKNLFTLPLELFNSRILGASLSREEFLRKVSTLYFKQKNVKNALSVLELLIKKHPSDAELLQKKGFCLQQLDNRKEALEAYLQADLVQPDSLWTLKRIAACYRLEKNTQKAIDYYRKAMKLAPNDVLLTFNMGHALVESGDYATALQHYFKAEILSEESLKTWRPIAWCSLMTGKYEQAETYYRKILQKTPSIEDYLNAGHLEWCKGFPLKAIERYKKGIRATHIPIPEFMDLFQNDMSILCSHGINSDDVPFVRDELLYSLEE